MANPRVALKQQEADQERERGAQGGDYTLRTWVELNGEGQAPVMVPFPVAFATRPSINAIGELPEGADWSPTVLPEWSVGILYWLRGTQGTFYEGVVLSCTARATGGPSKINLEITGTALRRPVER